MNRLVAIPPRTSIKTQYVVALTIESDLAFANDGEACDQIANAIAYHLRAAHVVVLQITAERPHLRIAPRRRK